MDYSKFNEALKEHYVRPMNVFYRERYQKIFNEEPPEDSKLMMDRMISHGESQVSELVDIIKNKH